MRALRITLIVLLVVTGLFVGADRLALKLVEDRLADELKTSQSAKKAEVSIRGFPFLTQVAFKELDEVDAKLTGVTTQDGERYLRVNEFEIKARDIKVSDNFSTGIAGTADGTAYVTYKDLTDAAEEEVTVGYGGAAQEGKAKVKVTGKIEVPLIGREVERSTTSTISVENGDTLRLHADAIPGANVPGLEEIIRKRIDYTRKIDGVPDGVTLSAVEATQEGVGLNFSGKDVKVTG